MWTYSGDPSIEPKDTVRFLVGDTRIDTPLAQDEEITWALDQNSNNVWNAAAWVAKAISFYFASLADSTQIGPIKIDYGKRAEQYEKKASELESKAGAYFQTLNIYVGGQSKAAKEASLQNTDQVQSYFRRDMTDYPGTYPLMPYLLGLV